MALLAFPGASVGAGGAQKAELQRSARTGAAPDAELERLIRERFAKSKIAVNGFRVRVQGGVAVIEGRTSVLQHKGTATRLARSAGAKKVDNRVEVSEAARRKASQNLAQGRRRAQVKRDEGGRK